MIQSVGTKQAKAAAQTKILNKQSVIESFLSVDDKLLQCIVDNFEKLTEVAINMERR
jgi:hypothetical protein